jgi:glutathione S-transferase
LAQDLQRIDELWCEGLDRFGGPYLAGPGFSAVDAFFAPVVFRMATYQLPLSGQAQAYADRSRELPSMREWYEAAIAEPWREASHEKDIASCGTITADHRARPD